MTLTEKNLEEALSTIAETQQQTAPVLLQIGYVDDDKHIHTGTLIIKECPGSVITELQKFGFKVSMEKYGLYVDKY